MRHVMRLGPFPLDQSFPNRFAWVTFGQEFRILFGDSEEEALAKLARESRDALVFEPLLAKTANKLGLQVGEAPEEARLFRAAAAVVLAHHMMLSIKAVVTMMPALKLLEVFTEVAPWGDARLPGVFRVQLTNPERSWDATVLGESAQNGGLCLYKDPAALKKVLVRPPTTSSRSFGKLDVLMVQPTEPPEFVRSTFEGATTLRAMPEFTHRESGRVAKWSDSDFVSFIAAMDAICRFEAGKDAFGVCAEEEMGLVEARLHLPRA